ncbi:GreA/GreB family elongation factor [Candidatus Microgenomates bacterium]|nr:GreA/GreB family elongation factor [Candidatus Microgenomates bacterium]
MVDRFYLSLAQVSKLDYELADVKQRLVALRRELAQPDVSGEGEHEVAQDDYFQLEGRQLELEEILAHAQVMPDSYRHRRVELGAHVVLINHDGIMRFRIVNTLEADPVNDKISDQSPLGKLLMGKKVLDEVELDIPDGHRHFRIVRIT